MPMIMRRRCSEVGLQKDFLPRPPPPPSLSSRPTIIMLPQNRPTANVTWVSMRSVPTLTGPGVYHSSSLTHAYSRHIHKHTHTGIKVLQCDSRYYFPPLSSLLPLPHPADVAGPWITTEWVGAQASLGSAGSLALPPPRGDPFLIG